MNDVIEGCRVTGEITLDGHDIYTREIDVVQLRARVGMVFQKPNPFPKSIYENIAYGPRIHGRSEEHTSELQSLMRISYAVFCLKKKTQHEHETQPYIQSLSKPTHNTTQS